MTAQFVLFDLGHVVVDWQPMRLYRQMFDTEEAARHFCENVCTQKWHGEHDRGVSMADNAADLIAAYPHYKEQILAWRTRWLDMFPGYMPGVPAVMAELEEAQVPLYGLSNLPAEIAQETFDRFPMIKLLRDVVVSGAEGVTKPDARIYEIALARMGRPDPATIFFIDNLQANIDAARRAGMRAHLFTGAGRLRQALLDEQILPG